MWRVLAFFPSERCGWSEGWVDGEGLAGSQPPPLPPPPRFSWGFSAAVHRQRQLAPPRSRLVATHPSREPSSGHSFSYWRAFTCTFVTIMGCVTVVTSDWQRHADDVLFFFLGGGHVPVIQSTDRMRNPNGWVAMNSQPQTDMHVTPGSPRMKGMRAMILRGFEPDRAITSPRVQTELTEQTTINTLLNQNTLTTTSNLQFG